MERATGLNPNESRALTGLRGCGALLVVAHHCDLHAAFGLNSAFESLLRRGYLGVDLFFVLSGFVLSLAYGSWFDGSAPGSLRRYARFLVRRVARLWPLHATVLLLIVVARYCSVADDDVTAHTLLANLIMTQAWGYSRSINVPTWSISTEFLAYLLFPLLAAPVLRSRLGLWLGTAAVLALLGGALHLAPTNDLARRGLLDLYHNYSPLPAARCLAGFTLGMLAWRAGQTNLRHLFTNAWFGPAAFLLALILMLAGINDLVVYALFPMIILGMHFGTGPVVRGFGTGPVHALGVLSYAIYLIHFELLDLIPFGAGDAWFNLVEFAAAVLTLSALAHRVIERPGRLLIRRLARAGTDTRNALSPLQRAPP